MTEEFSSQLQQFFEVVTADVGLQQELYTTAELSDVASIAQQRGFNVSGAEILTAQAGRVLTLSDADVALLAVGDKSESGAQWGRAGNGYLDRAGCWLLQLAQWLPEDPSDDEQVLELIELSRGKPELRAHLQTLSTYAQVADSANNVGCGATAGELVRNQARRLLRLDDVQANRVASGQLDRSFLGDAG